MLKGAKDIFENDALGRLKLIGWLHDFQNYDRNLYEYQQQIANLKPETSV